MLKSMVTPLLDSASVTFFPRFKFERELAWMYNKNMHLSLFRPRPDRADEITYNYRTHTGTGMLRESDSVNKTKQSDTNDI